MKTAYVNGKIYTVSHGFVDSFVVENGQFVEVGSASEFDKFVDLKGRFVTCGFNDSHMHILGYGQALEMMNMAECTDSLSHLLEEMKQYLEDNNGIKWLRGRGWNHDYFSDVNRMPTREDLDTVSKDVPIVATRACGHVCVVNSKALEILGINEDTPAKEGGSFDLETGLFRENCLSMIYDGIGMASIEDLKRSILKACQALNQYGITSSHTDDFTNHRGNFRDVIQAYKELEDEGLLTVKIHQQSQLVKMEELTDFIEHGYHQYKTNMYRTGPLKLLGDGSLGARTAFLTTPYADDPVANGISVYSQEQLDEMVGYVNKHGMPAAIHCIGDGMMKMVMNTYKKMNDKSNKLRNGIVHCQITDQELLDDFKNYHILPYIQPIFLDYDITMVESRVGKEKANTSYAFKTLFDLGGCGGSDCPVELPNVLKGIQCAVTRKTLKGVGPYVEKEALSLEEAIQAFTLNGAYASFEEGSKGSIEVGKAADFVVLSDNPFEVDVNKIKDIRVLRTYLNGTRVYKEEA